MRNENMPFDQEETQNEDFQFALKQLLEAYRPILEEDLRRADSPEDLEKEAEQNPPNCEDEMALANRIFEKFFTEEVAVRLLPPEARELLGNNERWRWCLLHIRCCIIFGWLVCRRPRTFRAFVYYLYKYWICVRQVLGTPVSNPLTQEEQQDFRTLTSALANAYKPYLTDQLASVEFPTGIPDEVVAGKIDCFEGEDAAAAIFERLLTVETAPALLGKAAFEAHSKEPFFWFCRCWCLCAIRFGCCLAQARNFVEASRCLAYYRRCLRECFGPLTCAITAPTGCVAEEVSVELGATVVPVIGTAAGSGFSHYILEWSINDIVYHATDFRYPPIPPGGTVQGNSPVFGGLLAYLDTSFLDPGLHYLRLTVFSVTGATCVFKKTFELQKKDVRIMGVDSYFTMDTSWVDPAAKFVETVPALCTRPAGTFEVSFGDCLTIQGGAFVGGCEDKKIKRYTIDYKAGFETNCATPGWTNIWLVEYNTPVQYRFINWRTDNSVLTSNWGADCMPAFSGTACGLPPYRLVPEALLYPSCWQTHSPATCQLSGLYTLRLTVEATDGSTYCDTQRIWIDNKPICAMIRIDAVPKCADLFVSKFAVPPDCSIPWSLPVSGIAYDEYIDDTLPLTRPNDNFDYYYIQVTKQGGVSIQIPIVGPGGSCFYGTSRVGDPGTRCTPHCDPAHPDPSAVFGTLALFDLRAVDQICKSSLPYFVPDEFTLPRGECCVYTFKLWVYDRTIRNTGNNWAYDEWPVKICNDLQ
jgi:hypothetical protein